MQSHLQSTILVYENHLEKYVDSTVSIVAGEYKEFLDSFLKYINKGSEIFEIGSGTGRDANYIDSLGFHVYRSDVTNSFIRYQEEKSKSIIKFDVVNDIFSRKFDLIYAVAVLLHFNKSELQQALLNIANGLNSGRFFAFSIKKGSGEEFSDHKMGSPRFFKYWTIESIKPYLESAGFEIVENSVDSNDKWLRVICKKI